MSSQVNNNRRCQRCHHRYKYKQGIAGGGGVGWNRCQKVQRDSMDKGGDDVECWKELSMNTDLMGYMRYEIITNIHNQNRRGTRNENNKKREYCFEL
jgi:hypothetical protein